MISFSVACIVTAFISALLAVIAYFRDREKRLNRIFSFSLLSIALWSLGLGLMVVARSERTALIWLRGVHYFGAIFIPAASLHFVLVFLGLEEAKKNLIRLVYISVLLLQVFNFTGLLANVTVKLPFRYYTKAQILYPFFVLVFFSCVFYIYYLLFVAYRKSTGLRKNQIRYLLLGTGIGFLAGSTAFFPVFAVPIFPFGMYFVFLYAVILTYAIIHYRLIDITFAVRDTIVHFITSLIISAIFIFLALTFFSRLTVAITILLTTIMAPYLYSHLRRLLRPVILGGKYEYQQKLRRISDKWFSIFSLDRLSETLVKDVAHTIGTKYCNFMIYDEDGKSYFVKSNTGFKEEEGEEEILFEEVGPLVSYLKKEKTIAIKEVLKIQPPFSEHDPVVKEMDRVKAALSVPLYIDNELKGILNLGDKVSGEMYNRQDLEILSQMARDAEVTFRYSFFNYEQSLLVYRYSHDLRTPLDPVQTYLYLMAQGKLNEEEKEKYLKIVRKNIDFVAQGLSDMYQLSQMAYDHIRKKFIFSHFDIIEMVKRIVEDFTPEAKKKEIFLRFNRKERLPLAYGHEQSIERMIRNLIQNGIKFTDKGGVEISISSEKEDIRIKVSDTGPGIPKKDLPRIFNPFFKTKGRDQIIEGSGLGLTIVREIVALHGGEINVESEVGKGTTFTVLLPAFKKRKIGVKSSRRKRRIE